MLIFFKKCKKIKYNEEQILSDLIEKYIEIANINDNTLDDYISIISLIYILKNVYTTYEEMFQKYLQIFKEKGIMKKFDENNSNLPKKIFSDNNWQPNINLMYKMLYGYFDNCPSRYINYLILFGLCGKPKTKKQLDAISYIFEANYSAFYKQKIYYTTLYLSRGIYIEPNLNWINNQQKKKYIHAQYYAKYKDIALAYKKLKDNNNFQKYIKKANYHLKYF